MIAPGDRPPGFVAINGEAVTHVFWGCLCDAGCPDDCDCVDAIWFERVGLYAERPDA